MTEFAHPGIEQSKTECPFCGNIWQEHTLNEIDGCMAIMRVQFSAAIARDATQKGKDILSPWRFEACPVCNKVSKEHTEDDIRSCAEKWRKRERGSTGLKHQGQFSFAGGKKEGPDPEERAKLKALFRDRLCSCGKARGEHTRDEIRACADRREREGRREI